MKKTVSVLIFVISFILGATSWGEKESGGNFEFYHTDVDSVIKQSQAIAIHIVTSWPDKVWQHPYFSKPVDHGKLLRLISEVRFNKEKEMSRTNPAGQKEPLMMNYATDDQGDFIEILAPYFRDIKERLRKFETIEDIHLDTAEALVHEALHHFGYNETEAYRISRFVYGFDPVLACDKVAVHFDSYKCVFPTPDRLSHVTSLLERWAWHNNLQPYSILMGTFNGNIVKVNLSHRFNENEKGEIEVSTNGEDFKKGVCETDNFPIIECSSDRRFFLLDISRGTSIQVPSCADLGCLKAYRRGEEIEYYREKLKKAQKAALLIKLNE